MTDPLDPPSVPGPGEPPAAPPATPPPAVPPPASGSASPASSATGALAALDAGSRAIAFSAAGVVLVALIGIPFGAWELEAFSIIVILSAIVAGGVAWLSGSGQLKGLPIASRDIELGGGAVAAVLAVWNFIEALFDLDQLDERGGILGFVLTVLLAVGAAGLLGGAVRRWSGGPMAALNSDRGGSIAGLGVALVLLGWALNLSISYWTMTQATVALTVVALAGALLVATHDTSGSMRTVTAATATVLGLILVPIAADQWAALSRLANRVDLSIADLGSFLIYVLGILALIVGGALSTYEAYKQAKPGPAGSPPA